MSQQISCTQTAGLDGREGPWTLKDFKGPMDFAGLMRLTGKRTPRNSLKVGIAYDLKGHQELESAN